MPEEIMQDIQPESNPDETAAVLSFATKLSDGLLPKKPVEPTQENQKIEESPEVDLEANNEEMGKVMDSKLDEFRKEMKEMVKEEVSGIKEAIQEALKEDDEE